MTHAESTYAASQPASESPERVYERNWALALLDRTTARLAAEFAAAGKSRIFEGLKPYLAGDRNTPYGQAAAGLGLSEVAFRVAVHRMRGRFRDLLVDEVSRTLPAPVDPAALEEELRYLLAVL
jgi:RNA polymerase sigma-70 factor (ECF subfamily)